MGIRYSVCACKTFHRDNAFLVFRGSVLRVDVVQPVDYEHVPVVPGERFRLVPSYSVCAHGDVVRTQSFARFRHA